MPNMKEKDPYLNVMTDEESEQAFKEFLKQSTRIENE